MPASAPWGGVPSGVASDCLFAPAPIALVLYRLRVAHTCSHKKQGYLHGGGGANAEDQGKSPEEYRATHAKCVMI